MVIFKTGYEFATRRGAIFFFSLESSPIGAQTPPAFNNFTTTILYNWPTSWHTLHHAFTIFIVTHLQKESGYAKEALTATFSFGDLCWRGGHRAARSSHACQSHSHCQ